MGRDVSYLKDLPIAVLGAGAVGMTCAADCKLASGLASQERTGTGKPSCLPTCAARRCALGAQRAGLFASMRGI